MHGLLHEQLDSNAYAGGAVILCACITGAFADLAGFNFSFLNNVLPSSATTLASNNDEVAIAKDE